MFTLVIEASSSAGSVALLRDDQVVGLHAVPMGASRDDALFPAVTSLLGASHIPARELGAIVCGEGPGSFTSLRIAGAIAKGLAHASGLPLYAVSSLLLAAASYEPSESGTTAEFVVHSDALRAERYALLVQRDAGGFWRARDTVKRVSDVDLIAYAAGRTLLRVDSSNATSTERGAHDVVPSAGSIVRVASWRDPGPVSLAQWEPAYGRLAEAQVKWEATHQRALHEMLRGSADDRRISSESSS